MAVDANVLIFERLKEELEQGKNISDALHEGFSRAWLSIRDSNISSIITAIILFWLGTSAVKGFALTLGLGVLVSMLTAISISRTFLFAITPRKDTLVKRFLFSSGFHSAKLNSLK
jgi:protein-export membrane protein SecD